MKKRYRRFRSANIRVPYKRQGLIWFTAQNFELQPKKIQTQILDACEKVGGEHAEALFAYVTSDRSIVSIMQQYYIASETTLYRMIERWYVTMDEMITGGVRRE